MRERERESSRDHFGINVAADERFKVLGTYPTALIRALIRSPGIKHSISLLETVGVAFMSNSRAADFCAYVTWNNVV
jgi:hypothetical protein